MMVYIYSMLQEVAECCGMLRILKKCSAHGASEVICAAPGTSAGRGATLLSVNSDQ